MAGRSGARSRVLLGCAVASLVGAGALAFVQGSAGAGDQGPLVSAWNRARTEGSYRFVGELKQTVAPVASIENAGRVSQSSSMRLEGVTDLGAVATEMQVSPLASDGVAAGDAVGVRVVDGVTSQRLGAGDWVETGASVSGMAPAGDFMAYLAAAREVSVVGSDTVGGRLVTKYGFALDGQAFEASMAQQVLAAHQLNPRAPAVPRQTYAGMSGSGELWVGADGLPVRQVLSLEYPATAAGSVSAEIEVAFSEFGTAAVPGVSHRSGAWWQFEVPRVDGALWLALLGVMLLLAAGSLSASGASRSMVRAVALFVVVALLGVDIVPARVEAAPGPAGSPGRAVERSGRTPATNPHLDRLAGLPRPQVVADPAITDPTSTLDTDGDGLTDFVEERIDTGVDTADSDADGVNDLDEVAGFTIGGVKWFGDPNEADSNGDGAVDGQEWAVDTDADLVPDVFDADNDNDLVPDRVDIGRDIVVGQGSPFSNAAPFELQVKGLTSASALPTMVEFQVRPSNPARMQSGSLELDWPADMQGQVRDVNDSSEDMRLVPMLEIVVPNVDLLPAATGTDANGKGVRPELDKLNVGYNPIDGSKSSWYAYVPLTSVEDTQSGSQAAFTGRMLYNSNGNWSQAQEVRLVWNVQVKNDLPCDATDAQQQAAGCAESGYVYDAWQTVQTYYDEFYLTGLDVTEEHGTDIAAIYEDPTLDTDLRDNFPVYSLEEVLSERFLSASADANTPPGYSFELTVDNLASKLSHASVGNSTSAFGLPNTFTVVATGERPTFDAAFEDLTSTVLPTVVRSFGPAQSAGTLQPLIVTAFSSRSRSVSLGGSPQTSAVAGRTVTFDLGAAGAQARVLTMAGIKRNPFCAVAEEWLPCSAEQVITEVDREMGDFVPFDPEDPSVDAQAPVDPALRDGQLQFARIYALSMVEGMTVPVAVADPGQQAEVLSKWDPDERRGVAIGAGKAAKAAVPVFGWMATLGRYAKISTGIQNGIAQGAIKSEFLKNLGKQYGAFVAIDDATPTTKLLNGMKRFGASLKTDNVARAKLLYGVLVLAGTVTAVVASGALEGQSGVILKDALIVGAMGYLLAEQVVMTVTYARQLTNAGASASGLLGASANKAFGFAAKFAVIGAVLAGLAIVGFFVYQMVDQGVTAFSAEFNDALAGVIAQLLYIALLTALSLTVVGAVVVAIVAFVDAIITLVCDAQGNDDCTTISSATTDFLKVVLFGSDPMVDTAASDLVVPSNGSPTVLRPSDGISATPGNGFSYTLDVTTNVTHTMWSTWQMAFYQYLYSQGSITGTKFTHSLNGTPVATDATWSAVKVGRDQLTDLYKASKTETLTTDPAHAQTFTEPGLNRSFEFTLSSAYSLPSYECWTVPNPFLFPTPVIPVCYRRSIDGTSESPLPEVVVDVFPATLDEFLGLAWDPSLRQPLDADGDGLLAVAGGGLDPNDGTVDSDGDGLSDRRELDLQQQGVAVTQGADDVDDDGLTDAQEVAAGTDPVLADTDNDGLLDGEEVRHLQNGRLDGGWPVSVAGLVEPLTVYSDPTLQDTDGDDISDRAEKVLTERRLLDQQGRPYHPGVPNSSPLDVVMAAPGSAGFYRPGSAVDITTSVTTPIGLQPSVVDVTPSVGSVRRPAPGLLAFDPTVDFDPITGAGSQTRQAVAPVVLPSGVSKVQFDAQVRAWLPEGPPAPSALVKETTTTSFVGRDLRPATADSIDRYAAFSYGAGWPESPNIDLADPADPRVSLRLDARLFVPNRFERACNDLGDCETLSLNSAGQLYRRWMSSAGRVTGSDAQLLAEDGQALASGVSDFSIASDGSGFGALVSDGATSRFIRFNAGGGITSEVDAGPVWVKAKLVWVRDRYVAFETRPGSTVVNCLTFADSGFPACSSLPSREQDLSSLLIARDLTTGEELQIAEFNQTGTTDPTALFYDARSDELLAVGVPTDAAVTADNAYTGDAGGAAIDGVLWGNFSARLGCTTSCGSPIRARLFDNAAVTSVTFDPASQQWLLAALTPTGTTTQFFERDLSAGELSTGSSEVACPAGSALPVISLPLNELPGATSFTDVSGGGRNARFDVGGGPDAGAAGAPSLQDVGLGVRFADASDSFTLPNTAVLGADASMSVALWVRVDDASSSDPFRITWDATHELRLRPDTGAVQFEWGNATVTNSVTNDGDWHLVVASATRFGAAQLAVAAAGGTPVVSSAGGNAGSEMGQFVGMPVTVRGGGSAVSIDQLQVYNSAPTAATIAGLAANARSSCMSMRMVSGTASEIVKLSFALPAAPAKVSGDASLTLRVDGAAPSSSAVVPQGWLNSTVSRYVLAGQASDGLDGSGVAKVEVSVDGGSSWLTATGTEAWVVTIPVGRRDVQVLTRATDALGNVEAPGPAQVVKVDKLVPVGRVEPFAWQEPARDPATNVLSVSMTGTASDNSSGIEVNPSGPALVEVLLSPSGTGLPAGTWQPAVLVNGDWSIEYHLPGTLFEVSRAYTFSMRVTDAAGNRNDLAASMNVVLDNAAPVVGLGAVSAARQVLSGSVRLEGAVTDLGGVGVDHVDVAFTPLDQVTGDAPRSDVWLPAALGSPGATTSSWSVDVPDDVEGLFQVDLRATDELGNETVVRRAWSGIVDTRAPRVTLTAQATGRVFRTLKQIDYVCVAEDLFVKASSVVCPGSAGLVNEFLAGPQSLVDAFQSRFPGQPVLIRRSASGSALIPKAATTRTASACDKFLNCTTVQASVAPPVPVALATQGAPRARRTGAEIQVSAASASVVLLEPADGEHVVLAGTVDVVVAAQSDAGLKSLVVLFDGVPAASRGFVAGESTVFEDVVAAPLTVGGLHTVQVQQTDWDDVTVSSDVVGFFADVAAPVVSFDTTELGLDRTWAVGTDFYRFSGTVSDDGTVASVQVQVNDGPWTDAAFGAGAWNTALQVPGADGSTLSVRVRAFDRAGRSTVIDGSTKVDLLPDRIVPYVRPETTVVSGPTSPLAAAQSEFVFGGVAGDNAVASFRCVLDGGTPFFCPSPYVVDGLSAGGHTLTVAAVDEAGYADLSPAEHSWTVTAAGPQTTLVSGPSGATAVRTGTFVFGGDPGVTFICSIDGAPAEPCTSPVEVGPLADGEHTFVVAGNLAGTAGTAARRVWTVTNPAPVVEDRSVRAATNDPDGEPVTLTATDTDDLTFEVVDEPEHGLVVGELPNVSYVPFADFAGTDRFTYRADDGQQVSSLATVTITVAEPDTEDPILVSPGDQTVTTSSKSSPVNYLVPVATDNSGSVTLDCVPPSGSVLPLGDTTVVCTASDESGNTATVSFVVHHVIGGGLPETGNGRLPIPEAMLMLLIGLALVSMAQRRHRGRAA